MKGTPINITTDQDKFIKENYLVLPAKRISAILGLPEGVARRRMKKLGLIVPPEIIEKFRQDSYIKKGNVSHNKGKKQTEYMTVEGIERSKATRFNGNPHNTLFDDAITIRKSTNHKYIRLSKGVWKELQIHQWEKIHGKVPGGFILACKDGNTLNCDPDNWHPITRSENALRNSGSINLKDGYVAKTIVGKYSNPDLFKELVKNKPLIDTARELIKLKRILKSHQVNKAI